MQHTLRKAVIVGKPSMLSMVLAAALANAPLIDDADHECTFVGNDRHTPKCIHCGELMDLITVDEKGL